MADVRKPVLNYPQQLVREEAERLAEKMEDRSMQFIKVELGFASPRPYTYGWDGGEIERNDFVVVPPNSYSPYPGIGRVLRVMKTPDFTGLLTVLRQKASLETLQVSVQQGSAEPDVPPGWEGVL